MYNRKSLPRDTRQAEKTYDQKTFYFFRLIIAVFFPHETNLCSKYRDSRSSNEKYNDIITRFMFLLSFP